MKPPQTLGLIGVHTRFFAEDVATLKRMAEASGLPWQIELRQLVRRALRGEKRDVMVLRDQPTTEGRSP